MVSVAMNAAWLLREYLRALGARAEVESTPGGGCRVELEAPESWTIVRVLHDVVLASPEATQRMTVHDYSWNDSRGAHVCRVCDHVFAQNVMPPPICGRGVHGKADTWGLRTEVDGGRVEDSRSGKARPARRRSRSGSGG